MRNYFCLVSILSTNLRKEHFAIGRKSKFHQHLRWNISTLFWIVTIGQFHPLLYLQQTMRQKKLEKFSAHKLLIKGCQHFTSNFVIQTYYVQPLCTYSLCLCFLVKGNCRIKLLIKSCWNWLEGVKRCVVVKEGSRRVCVCGVRRETLSSGLGKLHRENCELIVQSGQTRKVINDKCTSSAVSISMMWVSLMCFVLHFRVQGFSRQILNSVVAKPFPVGPNIMCWTFFGSVLFSKEIYSAK